MNQIMCVYVGICMYVCVCMCVVVLMSDNELHTEHLDS